MDLLCIDDIVLDCDWVEVGDNGEEISTLTESNNNKYISSVNSCLLKIRIKRL